MLGGLKFESYVWKTEPRAVPLPDIVGKVARYWWVRGGRLQPCETRYSRIVFPITEVGHELYSITLVWNITQKADLMKL